MICSDIGGVPLRTSLSSFIFLNYSLDETIKQISAAGFDAINFWGGRPHAYRNDLHEYNIRDLRILLDDLGLSVASLIPAQIGSSPNLCSPTPSILRDSLDFIQESIETAVRLGATIITVSPGHTLNHQDVEDGWNRLAESLFVICEFAAHYDVLIGIKPANVLVTDLINTSIQAMDMVEQLDCENLGVVFDTGQALIVGEDTSLSINHMGDRLLQVHVNDNHGIKHQRLIPGQGQYNFQILIDNLRKNAFDGFLSADLGWDYSANPEKAANEAQEYLVKILRN